MTISLRWSAAALALALSAACALAQGAAPAASDTPTAAPPDAKVYFIAPTDGARIRGPFVVQFGLRGMGVTQAGVTTANTGHHHLLIDENDKLSPGETIPADKSHVHFGAGQTETRLDLPPGRHTLQLVLGDASHRVFRPAVMSEKISITVLGPQRAKRHRPRRPRYYY